MIFLSSHLISIFIVDTIILILGFISLYWAIKISLYFDINEPNEFQYNLATKSYLVSTIISFTLLCKLLLFLYFIWSMDFLSSLIPGAMCAAGVVGASKFGSFMLFIKILNLFLLSSWLILNGYDLKSEISEFMNKKFYFFQAIFLVLVLEFVLQIAHFNSISLNSPVTCCSVIFSQNSFNSLPFYQKNEFILGLFVVSFVLTCIFSSFKKPLFFSLISIIFSLSSIYALIRFFSPYIYELPTHKCPFCLLQSEYYFIGYFIYALIFFSMLFATFALTLKFIGKQMTKKYYTFALIVNVLLFLILVFYTLSYYLENGVWL